ncbi:S-layer homology domain-containing protein [Cohnella hashimotonis]|uniref:S-layer homology domain-containing protein n=1 Tax=Cohnella hashimotonis TaxID=2826895 RepID=A0ABT6TFE1_9BACL|nr:S-layer homology domain-containing protein [Cohnella hashimotonis]MDI4645286.1 S-layer homology domain-containing protein [Cohnella hashimotonis]
MIRWRKWLVFSLIAALLLAPLQAVSALAGAGEPAAQDAGTYVRFKDDWKGMYLYEDTAGRVRYGTTALSDPAAEWRIEDAGAGKKLIRNRLSGRVLDMTSVTPDARITDPLETTAADASTPGAQWLVNDVPGKPGAVGVVSAGNASRLLNVQTQDGFAHANNWAQAGWGSATWHVESAESSEPVRILNPWQGTFLFEDAGKVKYGSPAITDASSQWFAETTDGKTVFRNRATGHVLNMKNVAEADAVAQPLESLPPEEGEGGMTAQWVLSPPDESGRVSVSSAVYANRLLNVQTQDGYAHANDWAQPSWGSALWKLQPAAEVEPVRLKDGWKGGYLFEDAAGDVKYGMPAAEDKGALWLVYDTAGGTLIRSAQSGNYLTAREPAVSGSEPFAWAMAPAKDSGGSSVEGHYTFADPADSSALLNVQAQDGAGHVNDWAQPAWGSAQWLLEDPALTPGGPGEPQAPSYIRIKSSWLQLYMYEEDGIVKYGNAAAGDPKAEWLVVSGEGYKRIQNRATGHFVTLDGATDARQPLRATDLREGSTAGDWVIEDYQGAKQIHSVRDANESADKQFYIHVENKLKFAQYGVINRDWSSPKWIFVPVGDTGVPQGYVTLKNGYRGTYLYEENGVVKDGTPDLEAPAAQWSLRRGEQGVLIVNRATGHLVSNEHVTSYESALEALDIDPTWGSAQWTMTDGAEGRKVFTNVWKNDQRIHDEDNKGFAQSSGVPADWGSAQWLVDAAPSVPSVLPDGYVRIRNDATGQYLYENARHVVLYGNPAQEDASSHWLIESGVNGERLANRATGNVMSIAGAQAYLETEDASGGSDASLWHIEDAPIAGSLLIRSGAAGHLDEYLHTEDRTGYAQYDLRSIESEGVRWTLETAVGEARPPVPEAEDSNGVTPAIADTNVYALSSDVYGGLLTGAGSEASVIASATGVASGTRWVLESYDGYTRVKQLDSGRYLSADSAGTVVLSSDGASLGAQWRLNEDAGLASLGSALLPGQALAVVGGSGKLGLAAQDAAASRWQLRPLKGTVTYEAENAFARGGVAIGTASGVSYAERFEGEDAALIFAADAPAAGSYSASVRYRGAGELALVVNGVRTGTLSLTGDEGWREAAISLSLREGYNSVELQGMGAISGTVAIDALIVRGAVASPSRGADVPYTTYEAERMNTNAQLVSGSRAYGTLSAESSGRQAVKLASTGDYVSFKTSAAANFLNIRYSIPDSEDGAGLDATLSVYVNGQKRGTLALTSRFSWVYGKYPYTNQPADGDPHRFYDEAQQFVGDIPAGATVALRKDEGDMAASYAIDFAELELAPEPLAMTAGYVSAVDFGAVPDDGEDDTTALEAAIGAAKREGAGLWLAAGDYLLSKPLEVSGVEIAGAGMWYSKLTGAGFMGRGDRVRIRDLTVDVGVNGRHDALPEAGFDGAYGKGSSIQHVWIRHAKAGVWTTLSDDASVATEGLYLGGLRVRDTYADGVHFSTGTKHAMLEHSSVRNTGDDAVALWSDPREGASDELARTEGNVVRFNTIQLPTLADNVAVFGGKDNAIRDNIITDTMGFGAGIAISTRFNPVPFAGTTVVERNTLLRTGGREPNWGQDFGAIWLFAGDKPIDADIVFRNNEAIDSTYQGFYANGDKGVHAEPGRKVTVENLVIDGAGTWGLQVNGDAIGSVTLANVLVRDTKLGRQFNGAGVEKFRLEAGESAGENASAGRNPQVVPDDERNGPDAPGNAAVQNPTNAAIQQMDEALRDALTGKPSVLRLRVKAEADGSAAVSIGAAALKESVAAVPGGLIAIEAGGVSYMLPITLIAQWLDEKAGSSSPTSATGAGKLVLTIAPPAADVIKAMTQAASGAGLTLIEGAQYEFELYWSSDGAESPINSFGSLFVDRSLTLNGTLDGGRTTALVYDPASRAFRPVPALFKSSGGKTTVTIRSTTNSIYVLADSARSFGDLAGHWERADIELLAAKRIVNGTGAGKFSPGAAVSRAEFAAMLVRALGLKGDGGKVAFKDIQASDWFAGDVEAAARFGLARGSGDGRFQPQAEVTREQMAVMLAATLKLAPGAHTAAPADSGTTTAATSDEAAVAQPNVADASAVGAWAREAIAELMRQGLLQGRPDGTFAPKATVTRAEAATAIKRLMTGMKLL